ncbi:hypothetical protein [Streptomyces acidiscabies]|uniref:Uncharacterized protein n=1 Tax=Streptomyces acidiscabies TaxID=42234 RepID=A0AAP6BI68_9ACTN|nr:hypothetical protein [Streptomyces acidiscabies]MBP5939114.1 hypothetical protein [Streptomyces sp. LBUM 1476]MBZ3910230.1 hypothetical protein [Streptomyces acidiscabies]MDX2965172.1 hypothetical protein [Streptomyces acidiscabies]MDX3023598.1 hypothetical protein [Streptomyces acidiscabies]MDX3789676.1 hypothetical protein [Streptomyces acidiscabies]
MPNNSTPYPQGFTTPEILDDCADCTALVGKWARHTRRKTTTGEPNKDYDPSGGERRGGPVEDARREHARRIAVRRLLHRYGWTTYLGVVAVSAIPLLGLAVLNRL